MPLSLSDFDFDLPGERIATRPVSPRDSSRLLIVGEGLQDRQMTELSELLSPGDLLVFNDTKVIPAKLDGKRGEARVELNLHQFKPDGTVVAFVKGAKKIRVGDIIQFAEDFSAEVLMKEEGEITLRFNSGDLFAQLQRYGQMPIPPYMKRAADAKDAENYQTIYAAKEGAVAAPTAGLHFTERLFAVLEAKGIQKTFVTLHVGAGTFLPVKVENIAEHKMHAEWGEISAEAAARISQLKKNGGRIVSVGTTSLRVLETAAKEDGSIAAWSGETSIFINPGYRFKLVDALLTNFHLPKSTLFMLVCAFAGMERMKDAYTHAIAKEYRFYSYGDACFLEKAY